MNKTTLLSIAGAGMMLALAAGSAGAAPVAGVGKLDLLPTAANGGGVEQVHWRHRHWGWRHRHRSHGIYVYGGHSNCWWRHGRRYCNW